MTGLATVGLTTFIDSFLKQESKQTVSIDYLIASEG